MDQNIFQHKPEKQQQQHAKHTGEWNISTTQIKVKRQMGREKI